ncbi:MAG: phytochelatin synthase family protein [Betaproteobacteria bacterium]|nr:phytochelatin synthase family protein [Betaproteobacteria bacterium]MDE2310000.1 phytochelatin synthase family protein [Betaproteobacteria bacterium]
MKKIVLAIILHLLASPALGLADTEPAVIYWDSAAGKTLRARIPADADYWQLSPAFAVQMTQSYCSVASAITVLNAMPIKKPVDPAYAPYAYFTQSNFFTPEVMKVISPQTVLAMGMTREQMAEALTRQGVSATSIAGDTLDDEELRSLLQKALGDDGRFVLANYLRANLGQVGGGHWSVLAAFDAQSDRVLILDVAKYKYTPVWVGISTLRQAIATIDTASNKARGLVIVSK